MCLGHLPTCFGEGKEARRLVLYIENGKKYITPRLATSAMPQGLLHIRVLSTQFQTQEYETLALRAYVAAEGESRLLPAFADFT